MTQIVWTESEQQLDKTNADVLVIFDCCHAGVLTRNTRSAPFSRKIFEYIGSTPYNRKAIAPGPESFTSALITSLSALAIHSEGFTTSKLLQQIENTPPFRDIGQVPVCSERGKKPCLFKLRIEPLDPEGVVQQRKPSIKDPLEESNLVSLQLEFIFGKCPTKTDISRLTKALSDLVKHDRVPLKKVLWQDLEEFQQKDFSHVAKKMVYRLRRRSLVRKLDLGPARIASLYQDRLAVPLQDNVTESPQLDSDSTMVGDEELSLGSTESLLSRTRSVDIFATRVRAYVPGFGVSTIWLNSVPFLLLLFVAVFAASAGYDLLRALATGSS